MLVIMEDGNIHQLAQALLDDKALGRLDVFEVDAAEGGAEIAHRIDEGIRIFGVDFQIDGIDIGKTLEEHGLAFHHRLGGERAQIAETENGRAIGNDGDQIAARRVVISLAGIFRDRQHRHGHTGRIGQRQVALRRHRLGRDDLELARLAL